jgi:transcriptional regulator with XRE-family HTH domain
LNKRPTTTASTFQLEEIQIDGARIRALRQARGWTQKELLFNSGVDQSAISNLESGRQKGASTETMVALARALAVPLDSLFEPQTNPTPVSPLDLQRDRIASLFKKMTPEERDLVIAFLQFICTQRRRKKAARQK